MIDIKVIVVVFVVISVCDSNEKLHEFSKHAERVSTQNYPCKDPKPRVLYLREIIGDDLWLEKYKKDMRVMRPYATVLHRCDGSGCCLKYNQRCKARHVETVKLTFFVISRNKYEEFEATNHTECGCEIISDDLIK